MRFFSCLAMAVLVLLSSSLRAHAESFPGNMTGVTKTTIDSKATTVDADRIEVYLDRQMRAFGDAEVHSDGYVIKGDRIDYNPVNSEIYAIGNVVVEQEDTIVEGSELRLKTEDSEGEMLDPVFHLNTNSNKRSRGSAKTLFFEGPSVERLKNARYTSCEDGQDDWYLRASDLKINHLSETATATNASIELKGMPILYTPWIDFPFSDQRQSGLLSSTFGTTSLSGFEFSQPYYWNIAPNMDATLTPRYLSKRGLQLQNEFRYLGEKDKGTYVVEYLPSDSQTGRDRFYTNLDHRHVFGNGWSGGLKFERASDSDYFSDMSSHVIVTSQINLPQQLDLRYDSSNWHFQGLAQQYQTLDKTSYPYQRLPQLLFNGNEALGPLDVSLWSEFVRFDKHSDAPARVTGNRFTAYPSISMPLTKSYGYLTPKIGMHLTKYNLGGNTTFTNSNRQADQYQSATRSLPIFSIDSGLYFDRDTSIFGNDFTHTLEPRAYYVYIPNHNQSRIPVFDTALSDINLTTIFTENQFSGQDRINDANQITLGLTSRLIDQKTGAQKVAATIAERFYFSDQNVVIPGTVARTGTRSDLFTALSVNLFSYWYANIAWQFDTDVGITEKNDLSIRYRPNNGKVLNFAYRFTRNSLEQIDISGEWPLGGNWYGLGRLNYSLRDHPPVEKSGPIEYLMGLEYNAGCWQGRTVVHRLQTATNEANYALFFQLELNGLGSIGANPLEVIKRSIPGYTSSQYISNIPR